MSTYDRIYPEFEFGDSAARLVYTGASGTPMFTVGGDSFIIAVANDQVLVSTVIRDSSGEIAAEIIDNEWKLNPGKTWDRNYNKNSLEVRDPSGDIVLQIRLVEQRVQFQARMYTGKMRGTAFVKGLGGGCIEHCTPEQPFKTKINPIFRYPSDTHFGELVTGS